MILKKKTPTVGNTGGLGVLILHCYAVRFFSLREKKKNVCLVL